MLTIKRILILFSIASSICVVSCQETSGLEAEILPDHWKVLEVTKASKSDSFFTWDFNIEKRGKYDLQIIYDGIYDAPPAKIVLETAGKVITEMPTWVATLNNKGKQQTVFQFGENILYRTPGLQKLKVETSANFAKIRIIPNYKARIGFGSGKYDAAWESMHNAPEKQQALSWFKNAKYGMFIHWGLYAQAGGIWKGTKMEDSDNIGPRVSEWLMFKFQIPRNEYAELAKIFNPDRSFARNIAKLAKDAGMKYMVITTKHHDGFALFDSKSSEFDMVDATPYKKDVIKELYEACLAEGIEFGVYYSHGNDWYDGADGNYANVRSVNDSLGILSHPLGKNLWDPSPNTHAEYIEKKALPQIRGLLALLPELRLVWFDGDGYITEDQAFQFYKTIYEVNPAILVNRRVGYDFGDYLDSGDNVIPSADDTMAKRWETCGTTNNSWAYKSYDSDFKSTKELLYYLVDIASKGGNYLLNIGPDGKGHVPAQSTQVLREIGQWLTINGEAIYGTSKWRITREGADESLLKGTEHRAKKGFSHTFSADDFWFTSNENKVYAISFVTPETPIEIKALKLKNGAVKNVGLLGNSAKIKWNQKDSGLMVDMRGVNTGNSGFALKITF